MTRIGGLSSLGPECEHMHVGMPVPYTKEDIKDVPTILSKEGELAERCGSCFLEYTADELIYHTDAGPTTCE
ncbi:unnamed protein product [Fusarium graminearum]|nr:unnamed protein product [Fusarium graminearum]